MTTEEMIERYNDLLVQYDRTVLYDDDMEADLRFMEVSGTLIRHTRLLVERLRAERVDFTRD